MNSWLAATVVAVAAQATQVVAAASGLEIPSSSPLSGNYLIAAASSSQQGHNGSLWQVNSKVSHSVGLKSRQQGGTCCGAPYPSMGHHNGAIWISSLVRIIHETIIPQRAVRRSLAETQVGARGGTFLWKQAAS